MSLSDFTAALADGGARNNRFSVLINGVGGIGSNLEFLCKSASLPAYTTGRASVFYHGRQIHLAGDRTFDPWTITIYNDINFSLRKQFESWSNILNSVDENLSDDAVSSYKSVAYISQLNRNDDVIATYAAEGVFPLSVSEISMDFGDNDKISEFTVQLSLDSWTLGE